MNFRDRLHERARPLRARIILPEGDDPRVRTAAEYLRTGSICEPVVFGSKNGEIRDHPRLTAVAELLRERRPDRVRDGVHALDLAQEPLRFAAGLVALGEADGCVAGANHTTADVIRAALWAIGTPAGGLLSSAFYMALPDDRVLSFTDCAVVEHPDSEQLAQIALVAASDRRKLVGDEPVVAFLSYSTHGSAGGPDIDRVRGAVSRFREIAPDVRMDGELQGDAALDPAIAEAKAPGSPVGGQANVLVFPDLGAGNIAYKLVQHLAGARAVGPIFQGLLRPMSDLSRGATVDDIVDVSATVALQGISTHTTREDLAWG